MKLGLTMYIISVASSIYVCVMWQPRLDPGGFLSRHPKRHSGVKNCNQKKHTGKNIEGKTNPRLYKHVY